MKLISKTGIRNLAAVGGFLVLSTAYVVHDGISSSSGVTGATDKPGHALGCTCHSLEASPETSVTISTEATKFLPSTVYRFKVTVTNPTAKAAGVNIAKWLSDTATAKSSRFFQVAGQGLRTSGTTQMVHGSPKKLTDHTVSFEFDYRTPPASKPSDTIYAVSNAVNLNGTDDPGDHWNVAPKFVINLSQNAVSPRTDIAEAFAIGPNPARNNATLYFMMKKPADLRIALIDAAGREVFVQQKQGLSFGKGEVMMDLTNIAAGDYLVNVTSNGALLYTGKISHSR